MVLVRVTAIALRHTQFDVRASSPVCIEVLQRHRQALEPNFKHAAPLTYAADQNEINVHLESVCVA